MDPKVLSYHASPYGDYQQGFCLVELENKCRWVLKVVKSKAGHIYCAHLSAKLGEEWLSFAFADKEADKDFLNKCNDQVKAFMEPPKLESVPEPQEPFPEDNQGLPF
jgi:hypothetical protein